MRSEKEIRNKIEELEKLRLEHSKYCHVPLDKCQESKEYDQLIDLLEWVLKR
ncbi:MAG: hypothetical protein ACPKPY_02300 [Nitrososphaeraceae archaeon]